MMPVRIESLVVGSMQENCYILTDPGTDEAIIIDPGDDAAYISDHIENQRAHPVAILATHGHFDHIMAVGELQLMYTIPFLMSGKDSFLLKRMQETAAHFLGYPVVTVPPKVSRNLEHESSFQFGDKKIMLMDVPGHTPGSLTYHITDEHIAFVGDVIFEGGSVGRTDFSYSDSGELGASIRKIMSLPPETILYPGHGNPTTVRKESVYLVS